MIRAAIQTAAGQAVVAVRHDGRRVRFDWAPGIEPTGELAQRVHEVLSGGCTRYAADETGGPLAGFDPEDPYQLLDGLMWMKRHGGWRIQLHEHPASMASAA